MKILVTGANGAVGLALVERLRDREDIAVFPGFRSARKVPDERIYGDLDGTTDWLPLLRGMDVVVHLAARVHVMDDHAADPLSEYRLVNRDSAAHLARQCARSGVRRLVYVSTIKVNGESTQAGKPFTPADPPSPTDPYGISKMEGEHEVCDICASQGVEWVIVRPPLIYGPGVRGNFRAMVEWVRRGLPLPLAMVTGNRRSLVAMENVVDFIATAATHHAAANKVFVVSDGEPVSTAQLINEIARALGRKARMLPVPPIVVSIAAGLLGRKDAADRLLGNLEIDISLARDLLDWSPPVSFEEGVSRAVRGNSSDQS